MKEAARTIACDHVNSLPMVLFIIPVVMASFKSKDDQSVIAMQMNVAEEVVFKKRESGRFFLQG